MMCVLLLCWALCMLHSSTTCFPVRQTSAPPGHTADNLEARRAAETKTPVRTRFTEKLFNERMQDTILRTSKGIIIFFKNQIEGCFSVLNVRSNKFLCLDSKRKLCVPVINRYEDCWFHSIKRRQHFDTICSCRHEMWLQLQQIKSNIHTHSSSEPSRSALERHQEHMHRRKRQTWHVDPSDPLGSEYPIVRTSNNQKVESGHGSNISKETITSVDDPLQVLQSHSPLSPTLEKDRNYQPVRF